MYTQYIFVYTCSVIIIEYWLCYISEYAQWGYKTLPKNDAVHTKLENSAVMAKPF
jgi:hypothetical protein